LEAKIDRVLVGQSELRQQGEANDLKQDEKMEALLQALKAKEKEIEALKPKFAAEEKAVTVKDETMLQPAVGTGAVDVQTISPPAPKRIVTMKVVMKRESEVAKLLKTKDEEIETKGGKEQQLVILLAEAQRKLLATPNDANLQAESDSYTRELEHLERRAPPQRGRDRDRDEEIDALKVANDKALKAKDKDIEALIVSEDEALMFATRSLATTSSIMSAITKLVTELQSSTTQTPFSDKAIGQIVADVSFASCLVASSGVQSLILSLAGI
jgi:hypothetical protein